MTELPVPVELTDAELDAVAAGAAQGNGVGGLVGIGVGANDVVHDVLNNADISILNNNNVEVGVGAALAVLGGAGVGLHQVI
jgi:hypothetical protein